MTRKLWRFDINIAIDHWIRGPRQKARPVVFFLSIGIQLRFSSPPYSIRPLSPYIFIALDPQTERQTSTMFRPAFRNVPTTYGCHALYAGGDVRKLYLLRRGNNNNSANEYVGGGGGGEELISRVTVFRTGNMSSHVRFMRRRETFRRFTIARDPPTGRGRGSPASYNNKGLCPPRRSWRN